MRVKKMEIENNWHCALEQSRVAQFFRFSKKRFFFYSARIASMRNFSRRVLFSFDFSSFFLSFLLYFIRDITLH